MDVGILNNNADITLFVMSEPGDIEYILVRHEGTAPTAGTIRFYVAPSGTALGSGSALGAAEGLSITVGIRKGGYRTTDAGTKFYPVASPNND